MIEIEKLTKLYYTIGEVAELFGVNTSLIRYWEKEFEIINPYRNKKGNRLFQVKDIETINIIHHLVKERGMTLGGAKRKLLDNREDTLNNIAVVNKLQEIKHLLSDVCATITVEQP